jgi:hypothetical protein
MAMKDVLSKMKPPVPAKNDPTIFAVFPHSRALREITPLGLAMDYRPCGNSARR